MTFPLLEGIRCLHLSRASARKGRFLMKLCKRLSTLALAVALVLSLTVPALAVSDSQTVSAQTAAQAAATYGGAVSVQYALWQDGDIVLTGHTGTFSKTENRVLMDTDLYGIGSISKIYTTVAVMQLAEDGKLSLDAPVTRYLKNFKMADPRYKDITVRMLLNHSSGLMGSTLDSALLFDDSDTSSTDLLLERLASQRLKADPGAYSVYCNDGFTLAELVVEAVSGMDFMNYVDRYILAPADLENTFAPASTFDTDRLARIYQGTDTRALPRDCLNAVGAGGMYASASDLAAFGGALTDSTLLSQSSLDAMTYPEYSRGIWPEDTLDMLSFGLGWDAVEWFPFSQSGIQALVKGGDTLYYHAGLVVIPEYDMAAAVVSSGGTSTYNELTATRILIDALAAEGVTVNETVPALPEATPAAMPADLTSNSGWYGATSAQYQVDVSADGTLTLHYLNYPSIPDQVFTYCSDGTFRDTTGTALLSFVRETNGETYLYQKAFATLPGLGTLPTSNYAAVKLPDNPVSSEVQAAWDKIMTMSVLPLTEKYTSQVYLSMGSADTGEASELVPGYLGAARIVDAQTALYVPQLPGVGGRDGQDLRVFSENGVTYLTSNNSLYMDAAAAPSLFTGAGWSYSTIQENGYARWYHVGSAAGKTMSVHTTGTGGFWVYDAQGQVVASSVLWDDTSVTLPSGGLVVFAGDPGARFHLSFRT